MRSGPLTRRRLLIGLTSALALTTGCGRDNDGPQAPSHKTAGGELGEMTADPGVAPGKAATATATGSGSAVGDGVSGTVVETMDSGGYTYAKLDDGGKQVWVAGPQTSLAVGMKIGKTSGQLMPGFHSSTLNRTFDELYFV